ncbi:hypothetical protein HNP84_009785 [Thermocatellispora tengchongensis]|uniref:FtsK domain-containing protein n=1 Tax=Thermocatellispora tengchongensis TaxID=1073253 RepID=A0A840PQI2_9ACTN|nr:hypothetical protein [Thermocatellispora tengchongensis]MBB5140020.1 hypothetical protein [Thermocatellispora tengchongensis]
MSKDRKQKPADEVARTVRRVAFRQRYRTTMAAPFAWPPIALSLSALFDAQQPAVGMVCAAATCAYPVVRAVRARRNIGAAAFGTGWMLTAAAAGPYGAVAAAGVAGWLWFSASHWRRHRRLPLPGRSIKLDNEPPEVVVEQVSEFDPEVARIIKRFNERLAAKGKALEGMTLTTPQRIDAGYRAEIRAVPGEKETKDIMQAAGKVASAFQTSTQLAVLEPVPSGDNSRAMFTLLQDDTLAKVRRFEDLQPRIQADGRAHIGYFYDLQPAHWAFFTKSGGMRHGIIVGDSEAGKSRSVETLISLAHLSDKIATVLLDPQGGSMPDWNGNTHRCALGEDDCMGELELWHWVMRRRVHHLARIPWVDEDGDERCGKTHLVPGDPDAGGMTGVFFALEEAPELLQHDVHGKKAVGLLASGAKTWRKGGGGILLVAQDPNMTELGGSVTLRAQLRKNSCALRTQTPGAAYQMGLPHDPSLLPATFRDGSLTQGLAYLNGIDRRAALMRWLYTEKPKHIARTPAAGRIDELTMSWIEEFTSAKKAGREPGAGKRAVTEEPRSTSGDVKAAIIGVLAEAEGLALELGELLHGVLKRRVVAPPSEINAQLKRLVADGRVWPISKDGVEAFALPEEILERLQV